MNRRGPADSKAANSTSRKTVNGLARIHHYGFMHRNTYHDLHLLTGSLTSGRVKFYLTVKC
jgi:hypothetical protein